MEMMNSQSTHQRRWAVAELPLLNLPPELLREQRLSLLVSRLENAPSPLWAAQQCATMRMQVAAVKKAPGEYHEALRKAVSDSPAVRAA